MLKPSESIKCVLRSSFHDNVENLVEDFERLHEKYVYAGEPPQSLIDSLFLAFVRGIMNCMDEESAWNKKYKFKQHPLKGEQQ